MSERTRRGLAPLFSVSLTLALVAVLAGTSPVSAGGAGGEFEVSPLSGPTGTKVEVRGTGCTGPSTEPTVIYSLEGGGTRDPFVSGSTAVDPSMGSWAASFAVPAGLAPGFYTVTARCVAGTTEIFDYPSMAFEVTPGGDSAFVASVEPDHGAPGDVVTVSGTGCTGPSTEPTVIYSLEGGGTRDPFVSGSTAVDPSMGSWAASFAVPAGLAPGFYTVTARCVAGTTEIFDYPSMAFEVTPGDDPVSDPAGPPDTPTAPTTPAGGDGTTATATPAPPVVAQPSFTG